MTIGKTIEATLNNHTAANGYSAVTNQSVAEFFAGIGLVRQGLENKGWKVTFANDIDQQKYELYAQNFANANTDYRMMDIHQLSGNDIPTVTMATASFPCNDLSLAGSYQGLAGKHSSTIWQFFRILDEMGSRRPPLVLLENVFSFLSSHQGQDFASVLLALNQLGYTCDAFVLDAAHFVPQSRLRLFVVGIQGGKADKRVAERPLMFYQSDVRPKKLAEFILMHPEICWDIKNLPCPPKRTNMLIDILEHIPHDSPVWWSQERTDYLKNQMSERHTAIAEQMIRGEDYRYGTVFRRVRKGRSMGELRVDGIAGCLRTPRGGSGRQILFKAGKGSYFARLLTPRECARLQGAPDSYKIEVPLNQALFGFGDAVCVPVIEWIAENYLNPVVDRFRNRQLLANTISVPQYG